MANRWGVQKRIFGSFHWMAEAACLGSDADFFPTTDGKRAQPAKGLCARCPVREDCLDYAIAAHEHHGIWGGMTPDDGQNLSPIRRAS
jgi:WhiB family redox-sensing transcriptional regulator